MDSGLGNSPPGWLCYQYRWKNLKVSAGYDLTALFLDPEGTLDVITKAVRKIWPISEIVGRILTFYDSIIKVEKAISEMKGLGIIPLIVEFLDRTTMNSLQRIKNINFPPEAKFAIIVDVTAAKKSMQSMLYQTKTVLESFKANSITITTDQDETQEIYEASKGAYSPLLNEKENENEGVIIDDIVVPTSELPETLRVAETQIKNHGLKVALLGHIVDGNIQMNIYGDPENADQMAKVNSFQGEMGHVAIKREGSVSAKHGIGLEKKKLLKMEMEKINHGILQLMGSIKYLVDSKNIMSNGKIFDE
ncbi:MAG: FAD-linked oxidase C-terminal domain-containing protein [Thermoplasmatales archaeon]